MYASVQLQYFRPIENFSHISNKKLEHISYDNNYISTNNLLGLTFSIMEENPHTHNTITTKFTH